MINIFVFVAAPLFGMVFTSAYEPLVEFFATQSTYLYVQILLLNLGASLGIIIVNIYTMKYDFVNLLSLIDLLIICLEASTYFYLLHNAVNLHCALFIIKKIGIGVAVGINFYLSLLMIKRKLIIFNQFCKMTILMYIFYGIGLTFGLCANEVMKKYKVYIPFIAIYSLSRLIYIKKFLKKQIIEPNLQQFGGISRRTSNTILTQLSKSDQSQQSSRNDAISKLFTQDKIRFLLGYYLITIAAQITPNLKYSLLSQHGVFPVSVDKFMFTVFQLLGSIFIYFFIKNIQNKLKYYLISSFMISIVCYLIGYFDSIQNKNWMVICIFIYMFLYGSSLGPFFYIFVGYRYNRMGFSICYVNKWLIYALIAVYSAKEKDVIKQSYASGSVVVFIIILLYFLLKDNELKQIQIQKKFSKQEAKGEQTILQQESSELKQSTIMDIQ